MTATATAKSDMDAAPLLDIALDEAVRPRIDHYLGPWLIEENVFRGYLDLVRRTDLTAHLAANVPDRQAALGAKSYPVTRNGVAIIGLHGALMKQVPSMADGTSTIRIRRILREAEADNDVVGIVLHIDSPGGTVAGTFDLADEVARINAKSKPVVAFIEDLGASAAYAVASQARQVYANNSGALIGSIGVLFVVEDYSARAAQMGIKVHVISTGGMKGAGVPGTEVTDKQREYWQGLVDDSMGQFARGVAKGRGMSDQQVEQVSDGRVYPASKAKRLGLIDGIATLDAVVARVAKMARDGGATMLTTGVSADTGVSGLTIGNFTGNQARASMTELETWAETIGEQAMSDTNATPQPAPQQTAQDTGPKPATLGELKATFPNSTAEWREAQLEAGATLDAARESWVQKLEAELAEKNAKLAEAQAKAARPGAVLQDAPPAAPKPRAENATAEWTQRHAALVKGGMTRENATKKLIAEESDLYLAYMSEQTGRECRLADIVNRATGHVVGRRLVVN